MFQRALAELRQGRIAGAAGDTTWQVRTRRVATLPLHQDAQFEYESWLFSARASEFDTLDAFVAAAIDQLIELIGHDRTRQDLNEVLDDLSQLIFLPPADSAAKNLLEFLPRPDRADLQRMDEPGVSAVAQFKLFVESSFGVVLTSKQRYYVYFNWCWG